MLLLSHVCLYNVPGVESALICLNAHQVCALQVFDSGLIGEGVLHMLAWAKQKLLTEDAVLVSSSDC